MDAAAADPQHSGCDSEGYVVTPIAFCETSCPFEGRIVVVRNTSGRIAEAATNHALLKSYSIVGVHLNLQLHRAPELVATVAGQLIDLYRQGAIKPQVTARYPLGEAPRALRAVMSRETRGKTVLTPAV